MSFVILYQYFVSKTVGPFRTNLFSDGVYQSFKRAIDPGGTGSHGKLIKHQGPKRVRGIEGPLESWDLDLRLKSNYVGKVIFGHDQSLPGPV